MIELDKYALTCADSAYMETPGPAAKKLEMAIKVYQWVTQEKRDTTPSLRDIRDFIVQESDTPMSTARRRCGDVLLAKHAPDGELHTCKKPENDDHGYYHADEWLNWRRIG